MKYLGSFILGAWLMFAAIHPASLVGEGCLDSPYVLALQNAVNAENNLAETYRKALCATVKELKPRRMPFYCESLPPANAGASQAAPSKP
jgi:hypothetical protein